MKPNRANRADNRKRFGSVRYRLLFLSCVWSVSWAVSISRCFAPPPLVTGDVPTADKQSFEWYLGARYQESESGKPSRQLPFTELVYGLSERQEITFEIAGLSQDHHYGISDSVVGTKYVFLKETGKLPGIAGSFELKLPTGDESRGLGSGEFDCDLRVYAGVKWEFGAPWKREE